MDDRDFFDHLFQQFAKTTGAENQFWIVEKDHEDSFNIWAVDQEQNRTIIASDLYEVDADFVAGLHGCLPDLVRRLHDALDEADRLDQERDSRECLIAELAMESEERFQEIRSLRGERESWVSRAGDTLWKIERPM